MKLVTFLKDGIEYPGIVKNDQVKAIDNLCPTMVALISDWENLKQHVEELYNSSNDWIPLSQVTLKAPITRPGKMLAIGLNYADHIAETGKETPSQQMWFMKASSSTSGPYDRIQIPKTAPTTLDYEVELVVVIGKGGRHISIEDAPKSVFGYCVGNDISVREWQRHSPQWSIAKSFDSHSPFGPWITTSDELNDDPHGLEIVCTVSGEERQKSNTQNLVFNVWQQIEYLSKAMTLEPGDIIFTGTPGGVGWARNPPGFLQEGDRCRCEIEKLGYIEGLCQPE